MTRWHLDLALGAAFAVLGAVLAVTVLWQNGWVYFYQLYSPEPVYWACGHGFGHTGDRIPPLTDFLGVRVLNFDCAELDPALVTGPLSFFTKAHLYLMAVVALLWRLLGVSYQSLWPLLAMLGGAYAAGVFTLLRQFFGRWPAALGALVLALSPVALALMVYPRDFAKAPFFVWCLVFLIFAMRGPSLRQSVLWAALAGALAGIGYGFRSDVIILLPIGALGLLVAIGPRLWAHRLAAAGIFLASGLLCASPMLLGVSSGGFGAMLAEGASDPFTSALGVEPGPYSLGPRYSDEFTFSAIAADLRAADPGYDSAEGPVIYSLSQALTRSGAYVAGWLHLFVGDLATRALKGAGWILGMPAFVAPDVADAAGRTGPPVAYTLEWLYDLLGQPWLPFIGIAGLAVLLWRQTAIAPRRALALTLMLGALLAYPVLQFSIRHIFHLEFLWVAALLALAHLPLQIRRLLPAWKGFAGGTIVLAAGVGGLYLGLVTYQDVELRSAISELLRALREPVGVSPLPAPPDLARLGVAVPEQHLAVVEGTPDSMYRADWPLGVQWDVRAGGDRLLLFFSGSDCAEGTIRFDYADKGAWQPFDHELSVRIASEGPTIVLVPALYRATQYLEAIEMPAGLARCFGNLQRVTGKTRLPMLFSAVLEPAWEKRPLHQGLGSFTRSAPP